MMNSLKFNLKTDHIQVHHIYQFTKNFLEELFFIYLIMQYIHEYFPLFDIFNGYFLFIYCVCVNPYLRIFFPLISKEKVEGRDGK